MEALKSLVATLTTVLIFISAVELIAPKNKIKKYISFVLGLILISVILNPIIKFISNGERSIQAGIENYTSVFSKNENRINSEGDIDSSFENNSTNNNSRKSAFIKNFNKNCDSMLKNKFPNLTFKSNVDCDVDFVNININIKKLRIGIKDKSIKKIEPIMINDDKQEKNENLNNEYGDIITYVSSELKIPKEKIEVYRLDE
ncbi:stage III sporulation protein AF [Clostridium sp. SM-530-WT-3G]|uniref:stage III sporulation protein AF n=1 Tax=Clostridium sp. SM-530-WT-3G TaxID=2725303 RepID=UPI00145FA4B8|nr:stage III sporulation protein AF [Clostridium sp. SM-530-WT-3G]NME83491.1 stage III sporulation protein AF [Clostridium sp. SM-530-WT-3G]